MGYSTIGDTLSGYEQIILYEDPGYRKEEIHATFKRSNLENDVA